MPSKSCRQQKEQAARVHGNRTNRKAKDRGESRTVFKSVLDNPLEVKWPVIALNVQNAILARVIELVQGVAEYNLNRQKQSRASRQLRKAQRKGKASEQGAPNPMEVDAMQQDNRVGSGPSTSTAPAVSTPEICQAMTVGINEITKRLEEQCRIPRQVIAPASTDLDVTKVSGNSGGDKEGDTAGPAPSASLHVARAPIRTVLVCRSDIDPPLLVSHIPHLVAACNSATKDPGLRIKLVSLPKGADISLAQAMGLRRVAALAFDETLSKNASLSPLLSSVDAVIAPWLVGVADFPVRSASKSETTTPRRTQVLRRRLEPTHIKQLRTTAPKDMRAAKALRAKGRAEAKAKRKAREGEKKIPAKTNGSVAS